MQHRIITWSILGALCALGLPSARAGTVSQSTYGAIKAGTATGAVQAGGRYDFNGSDAAHGAIMVVPTPGDVVVNDDFNYATKAAAQAAGWLFLTPNEDEIKDQVDGQGNPYPFDPSEFLFSGDTSAAGGAPPAAGALRIRAGRPYDMYRTSEVGRRSPVLALYSTPITGDFIVETRFTIAEPRTNGANREFGIFIGLPDAISGGKATGVVMDDNARFITTQASTRGGSPNETMTTFRLYPYDSTLTNRDMTNNGAQYMPSGTSSSQTWAFRIVKRGDYFFTYYQIGGAGPWALHTWIKNPDLAQSLTGMLCGVYARSNINTPDNANYRDADFDYFKVSRIGSVSGTFTNVLDAGAPVNWQTFNAMEPGGSLVSSVMNFAGTKYQLRAGNALSGGSVADGGPFVGPDGTGSTFFYDDAAAVVPGGANKRYLEYKFTLNDVSSFNGKETDNLTAYVGSVNGTFGPSASATAFASSMADFGADAGGISTQPGDGDLSLTRTQVFRDDFTTATLDSGWAFDAGAANTLPGVVGDYSLSDRPGFLRLKTGYPQDFRAAGASGAPKTSGATKFGGVKMLRSVPNGVNDWEIETQINLENQQNRPAGLLVYQDPDNWLFVGPAKENAASRFAVGVQVDVLLNDESGTSPTTSQSLSQYGSNQMQLRVTKKGQLFTFAARDTSAPSPSWRVVATYDTTGKASGGVDFVPYQVGLIARSDRYADRATLPVDFDYFSLSTVADNGAKPVPLTVPAGGRADTIVSVGDNLGANYKTQISNGQGGFVGPDGTSATFFTPDEPKVPDALNAQAHPQVRVVMDNTTPAGMPYLHAVGLQYARPGAALARDTNTADFNAGTVKTNVNTTTPGWLSLNVASGTTITDEFDYTTNDLTGTPWEWVNASGKSSYSFTDIPGSLNLNVDLGEQLWTNNNASGAILQRKDPAPGDFDLETKVNLLARGNSAEQGLFVSWDVSPNSPGTRTYLMFGPTGVNGIQAVNFINGRNLVAANIIKGPPSDQTIPGDPTTRNDGLTYWLRMKKTGDNFALSYSPDGTTWYAYSTAISNPGRPGVAPRVGVVGWHYSADTRDPASVSYEYFKFTPIQGNGTFESRVLDLGASGLTSTLTVAGTALTGVTFQFRAADTAAGLASLPYVGPDGTANSSYAATYTGTLDAIAGKRYVQYKATFNISGQLNDVLLNATTPLPPSLTVDDARSALRIAGGLQSATSADLSKLDIAKGDSAGKVDLQDAVRILRQVTNP